MTERPRSELREALRALLDCIHEGRLVRFSEASAGYVNATVERGELALSQPPAPEAPCTACQGTGRFSDHECRMCAGKGRGSVFQTAAAPEALRTALQKCVDEIQYLRRHFNGPAGHLLVLQETQERACKALKDSA